MLNPKEEGDVMELITSWEKKGIEKGIEKEKVEVAKKMLLKGLEENLILEVTGLSKKELAKLKDDVQYRKTGARKIDCLFLFIKLTI